MKAELYNYKAWVAESTPQALKELGNDLLEACKFEVLGFMEHHFQPQGYTCLWLLGESHLAIHTYPEHSKSYIELTSCVASKNMAFKDLLFAKVDVLTNEFTVSA